ncbi:LIV-I protein H [Thalassovita gelatinovora]|uniref:LIV-I protein H n=1 Tax=Thalassovita gelatinovora TaxID=53501 RepID=A0A0P1FHI0_THAGE|nr:urea ABC transporter permease subunit UrtB [Thalassovita gelatinovora]QIZ82008.1 urea ABC transporter permease subunit UrtB [Thalassovita gelatinovora]CUH67467.1 LIV-I protein H [Thalassovita gelatinovora]SEP73465.1 amino acid/amide ABC transporter membrane protein 1, HAAT family [Thalassovita gelatinovora]
MDVIANQLFAGLSMASILLMIALGLAIIYGAMGVINLAHGEFVMLGAYAAWALQTYVGIGILLALPFVFISVAVVGWIVEKVVVQNLYHRPLDTILATWGIGIILQQTVRLGVGAESRFVKGPDILTGNTEIGPLIMSNYRLFVIVFSIAVLAATWMLMTRTEFGMKLRAVIQNRGISECYGIEAKRIYSITFAYGAGLAGIAGALITPLFSTIPTMGTGLVVDAFLVVIVGGLGSLIGSAAASVLIGEATAIFSIVINDTLGRIAVLAGIILLIRFRPRGLFPTETRR